MNKNECDIIDYLTIQIIENSTEDRNPATSIRTAWIEAKKIFEELSEEEKEKIKNEIRTKE